MDLKVAKAIAVEKCYLLQPYCEIIKIAGGIRRKKPFPHDIEIVVMPKKEIITTDLFDTKKEVRSMDFISVANRLGDIVKGKAEEKMMQTMLPEKIMLDLFIPDDFDYYRQYAIRTGSKEYAQKVIASGWLKIGWCGSNMGLRKQSDCISKTMYGKNFWICTNALAEKPPVWDSEESFFRWLKVKWVKPELRN